MISGPGAAMLDTKLFVSRLDGPFLDLYERWWNGDEWIWVNLVYSLCTAQTSQDTAPRASPWVTIWRRRTQAYART